MYICKIFVFYNCLYKLIIDLLNYIKYNNIYKNF